MTNRSLLIKKLFFAWLLLLMTVSSHAYAGTGNWKQRAENTDFLHRAIKLVTDVMVHDIYSPPVASRTYAYISIAAYEAARYQQAGYKSLAGQLRQWSPVAAPIAGKNYSYALSAVNAVLLTGKTMVISEDVVEAFRQQMLKEFLATGMPQDVYDNSLAFGKSIAEQVLAWAAKDNYRQTRAMPKYTVTEDSAYWQPTPPAYMKAVEPYWNRIRPFLIDSAAQFKPAPAIPFSTDKASPFYKEALEVEQVGTKLTQEQMAIANFWDCNPFKMNINGHVMFATKKISPGGHWINITRLACKKSKADLARSAAAYACVSVVLADAFISCWDEKYRSRVIRPETYINRYISQSWMPLLQTPPFPEYTSGHSVVSAACSVVLTNLFGKQFSFADSTETEFGMPVRSFHSFSEAAAEAAISRFYGGIHYNSAITNGLREGEAIGKFVTSHLQLLESKTTVLRSGSKSQRVALHRPKNKTPNDASPNGQLFQH